VHSLAKPFSALSEREAFDMLGLKGVGYRVDDSLFPVAAYTPDQSLGREVAQCTGLSTWKDVMELTGRNLTLPCHLSGQLQHASSRKELIRPVMYAVAAMTGASHPASVPTSLFESCLACTNLDIDNGADINATTLLSHLCQAMLSRSCQTLRSRAAWALVRLTLPSAVSASLSSCHE
jgi:hypothetical protein